MKNEIIRKEAKHKGVAKYLYIIEGTVEGFLALNEDQQADFIFEAISNVAFRVGKFEADKEPKGLVKGWVDSYKKDEASRVSFADVAALLATKGERKGGKPEKVDLEWADQRFVVVDADAKKAGGDYWATVQSIITGLAERVTTHFDDVGGVLWEWQSVPVEEKETPDLYAKRVAKFNLAMLRKAEKKALDRRNAKTSLI